MSKSNPTLVQSYITGKYGKALVAGTMSIREVARISGASFHSVRTALHIAQEKAEAEAEKVSRKEVLQAARRDSLDRPWRVVVIGDAHFKPGVPITRAILMGKFITEQAKDAQRNRERVAVVCIGDWHDMEALSSYDKGKASGENRRFQDDIDIGNDAIRLMMKHIDPLVTVDRFLVTLGNHEYRMQRAANDSPEYAGFLDNHLLAWETEGWEVFKFGDIARIDDVMFCHYFQSEGNGRAISSVNMGRQLLLKNMASSVCGHSHLFKTDTLTTMAGAKIVSAVVGCAFEHDEDYRGHRNPAMDRGLVVLHNLKGSHFRPHFHDFTHLRKTYNMPGADR